MFDKLKLIAPIINSFATILLKLSVSAFFLIALVFVYKSFPLIKDSSSLISEAHRATLEVALTAKDARKASDEELKDLPVITNKVENVVDSVNTTVNSLNKTIISLNGTVDSINKNQTLIVGDAHQTLQTLNTTVASLNDSQKTLVGNLGDTTKALNGTIGQTTVLATKLSSTVDEATQTTKDLDKLVSDPSNKQILAHMDTTTDYMSKTMADIYKAVHEYVHPAWYVDIVNWTTKVSSAMVTWLGYIF